MMTNTRRLATAILLVCGLALGCDGSENAGEDAGTDDTTGDTGTADSESASDEASDSESESATDGDTDSDTDSDTDTGTESEDGPTSTTLEEGDGRPGLMGWNILTPAYTSPSLIDMLSFEWDYFMIHSDDGRFTGSIGYLIANPRNANIAGMGDLVPKGGNAAVAGRFDDGEFVAEYRNFGLAGFTASGTERRFDATDDADDSFATMTPVPAAGEEPEKLHLQGQITHFAWDVEISQDWPGLSSWTMFEPEHGADIGALAIPGEEWNVNMLWPRTRITGTVTNRDTGEEFDVTGHGYRENSWGRWAFNQGGWDFAVVSDDEHEVMWAWQSYHYKSKKLDYLDVGFMEDGVLRMAQFRGDAGELGWSHGLFTFDDLARQCLPRDTTVIADNGEYRIEATIDLGDDQVAMLSDATTATRAYVIEIQFPWVEGVITRLSDNVEVATFSGLGGGEFSVARRAETVTDVSDEECATWGEKFSLDMP